MSARAPTPDGPFPARKIILRPSSIRGKPGWQVWQCEKGCPMFGDRRQAIDYEVWRGNDGSSTLELRDAAGNMLRSISGAALAKLARPYRCRIAISRQHEHHERAAKAWRSMKLSNPLSP